MRFWFWLRFSLQAAQRVRPSVAGLGQSLQRPSSFRLARRRACLARADSCRSWRVFFGLAVLAALVGFCFCALGLGSVLVSFRFGGRVTHLELHENGLSGQIPPELGRLDNLLLLNLSWNRLSGQVPPDLLSGIENLTWLSLGGNRLTGCVPSDLRDKLSGPRGHIRGLPFCDEVPASRPCKAGMVLKSGEYCTMDTRPWDSSWHPAWPYQLEVRENFACLVGVRSSHKFLRGGFSASKNSDMSWTVHRAPLGIAPPLTPTPSLDSNFGRLSMGPNDNNIVNIYMVHPSPEEAEALAKQQLGPLGWPSIREVRTFKVKYSKIQLDSWSRILTGYLGGSEFPEMTGGGVRISENKV